MLSFLERYVYERYAYKRKTCMEQGVLEYDGPYVGVWKSPELSVGVWKSLWKECEGMKNLRSFKKDTPPFSPPTGPLVKHDGVCGHICMLCWCKITSYCVAATF